MASDTRSEVEVLADQVALVEAASDFVVLKGQYERARQMVEALSRRLEPDTLTPEEAVHRALPKAIRTLKESEARLKGGPTHG